MSTPEDRLVSADVLSVPTAASGGPATVTTPLTTIEEREVGLWDMAPGTDTDTEVDEPLRKLYLA